MTRGQIRLAYVLTGVTRAQKIVLLPQQPDQDTVCYEAQLRSLKTQLHSLDQVIAQEICSGVVYGHLSDTQLARLLPLLAQRRTCVQGQRLEILERELIPRVRVGPHPIEGIALSFGLSDAPPEQGLPKASPHASHESADAQAPWLPLSAGRLVVGGQAFFLQAHRVFPVRSGAPWLLSQWMREDASAFHADSLSPEVRDVWVRDLSRAGVPPEDLKALTVQRQPPDRFVLQLVASDLTGDVPTVGAILKVCYGSLAVELEGQRPASLYVSQRMHPDHTAFVERDVEAEEMARKQMRQAGFRYDRSQKLFVAQHEAAVRMLDPSVQIFPADWTLERGAHQAVFHQDLTLHAKVQMHHDPSLLDVHIDVQAVRDAETVATLLDMKHLLAWLQSGKHYIRLKDGSYAAPSGRFRRSLRLLDDLGAVDARVWVSPLCIGVLRALGDQAGLEAADEATRAWIQELSASYGPRVVEPPSNLQVTLRDYQRRGLDWLMMLHRHRLAGILADDMGLGKTLQTLALLLLIQQEEGSKPSLVVAPTSVVGVWHDEAQRFAPSLRVALWYGPPSVRHAVDASQADVVVTSYGILRRDIDRLEHMAFRYVILDEAQSAKNASSHNARAIRHLKSERRLALTGTPLENRPEELWAVFDFLAPGFLGTLRQFRTRYTIPIARGDTDALKVLRLRMQPLLLRRLKTEVAKELPPKVETTVRCDMSRPQRALYDHIAGELRDSIKEKIAKVGIEGAQLDILAALTRLRQICCDPALLPVPVGTKTPPSAKLALFEELMREALASDRCVVVFSQFVRMQQRLIDVIKALGVDPLWLHGGSKSRDKIVAAFQDPQGPQVIVVSLRAGGTGLTLTRADTVMHYDPWWNPAVERQATDRTHRLGQNKTVSVYKLICAHSIEERVLQLAEHKQMLVSELLGSQGDAPMKRITPDEILMLLA